MPLNGQVVTCERTRKKKGEISKNIIKGKREFQREFERNTISTTVYTTRENVFCLNRDGHGSSNDEHVEALGTRVTGVISIACSRACVISSGTCDVVEGARCCSWLRSGVRYRGMSRLAGGQ